MGQIRPRLLSAALSLFALAVVPAVAAAGTVSPSAPGGMVALGQATGALHFDAPPQPAPLGTAAARLTTGAGGWDAASTANKGGLQRLFVKDTAGQKLADVDHLVYRVLREHTDNSELNVALKAEVLTEGTTGFTTLTYEPTYNDADQAMQTGQWQTWDAIDGGEAKWWSSRAIDGVCKDSCFVAIDDILAANPETTIIGGLHLSVGQNSTPSGWDNFIGWVDGLEVGFEGQAPTTYDFEDDASDTVPVAADGSRLWAQVSNAARSAEAGDTIDVAAGTYVDQVFLHTDVTLRGAGDDTVIQSPVALEGILHNGATRKPVIGVGPGGSGSTIEDLTVDGAGRGSHANLQFIGIGAWNAAVTIDGVHVTGIRHNPLDGVQNGLGIWADTQASPVGSSTNAVVVRDSVVDDVQKNGITVNGDVVAEIAGNTITGMGATGVIAQNGIQVSRRAAGEVVGNTIAGHSYTNHAVATAAGVLLYQSGDVDVRGNTLTNNDVGVDAFETGAVTASFNRLAGNGYAGMGSTPGNLVAEHNWWGCNEGPADADCDQADGAVDAEPFLELVTNAAPGDLDAGGGSRSVTARLESSDGGQPAGLDAFPAVTVGFAGVLGAVDPATDVLSGAGSAATTFVAGGVAGAAKVTASLDAAAVDQPLTIVSDGVTLVDGDDTTADADGCGSEGNPCNTIRRGIEVAAEGDEVRVAAGEYGATTLVDKRVVLKGAKAGVDARDRDATGETVLDAAGGALNVIADDVVVDGFTVTGASTNPLGTGIALARDQDGAQIRNTRFVGNKFGLYLNSADGGDDTVVERNLFKDNNLPGSAAGNGIYSDGGVHGALIRQNRFEGHESAASVIAGNGGDGVTFGDNDMVDDSSVVFFNTDDVTVEGNRWTSGGAGSAVYLGGGVDGAAIRGNDIGALNASGVSINNDIGTPNTGVEVVGNTITGRRRAITVSNGAHAGKVEAHFNRLVGNAVALRSLDADAGDGIAGENNWFGSNDAPAAPATEPAAGTTDNVVSGATVDADPRLVLGFEAADAAAVSSVVPLTATIRKNSAGATPAGNAFPAAEVEFDSALGSVAPDRDELDGTTDAATTLATGATEGDAAPSATLDGETVTRMLRVGGNTVQVDGADTLDDALGCGLVANPCNTINRGVAAALTGETVEIAAGTYPEQVVLGKRVTLRGAGDDTVIRSPATLTGVTHNGATRKPIVGIGPDASGSSVEDLSVDGAGQGAANNQFIGIGAWNADATIDSVHVTGVRHEPLNGVQNGLAIWADSQGATKSVAVRDSIVEDFQKNGITVNGDVDAEISGNTVTGIGATGLIAQNGIQVSRRATGELVGNTIGAHRYTGDPMWSSAGVILYESGAVEVRGNTLDDNDNGVTSFDTGVLRITGNTITGNHVGIDGTDAPVQASFNRIAGNDTGLTADDSLVRAENNWWGCNAGPSDAACDAVVAAGAAEVDAAPWLRLSVSASPASIASGGATSQITASLRTNSDGDTPADNAFPGTPIAFATTLGSITAQAGTGDEARAVATLTSNQASGNAQPSATLDGETVRTTVRFGDLDGDGLVDNADCAPNDASRPFRPQGQDQNCDGVRDPAPPRGPNANNGNNGNPGNPPQQGSQASSLPSFLVQFGRQLGANPLLDRGLNRLRRIGVDAYRPRGTYQLTDNGLMVLLGFGCQTRCTITPTVTLLLDSGARGATAAKTRRVKLRVGKVAVAAGRVGVLRVRINKKTRAAIRRARRARLSVTVSARTTSGQRATDSHRYGLKVKKAKRTRKRAR